MCRNDVVALLQDLDYLLRQSIDALLWNVKSGACCLLDFAVQLHQLYHDHCLPLHAFMQFYKSSQALFCLVSCDADNRLCTNAHETAGSLQVVRMCLWCCAECRTGNRSRKCCMLGCILKGSTLISSCLIPYSYHCKNTCNNCRL